MEYIKDLLDKNNNGEIDAEDFYLIILELMKKFNKDKLSGEEKKIKVLKTLRDDILSVDTFERYEPLIAPAIDFIFLIAQKPKHYLKQFKKNCKCIK